MGILKKILLLDLPESLEKAIKEQFQAGKEVNFISPSHSVGETCDLVIHLNGKTPYAPAGVPLLPLGTGRKERLGRLLRQMAQMLDEPSLWIGDFRLGPYLFRPSERLLTKDGGSDIILTDRETDILVYLARQDKTPVTRDDLLKNVWRYHEAADTHTLETHIYRLRQKIEAEAENPRLLVTAAGGYQLNME